MLRDAQRFIPANRCAAYYKKHPEQMRFIERNTIVSNVALIILGIIHFFVIVSIMTDNWINYKTAFWIEIPILLTYLFTFLIILKSTYRLWGKSKLNFTLTSLLTITNLILLILTIYLWIDLFDGKTNALLP